MVGLIVFLESFILMFVYFLITSILYGIISDFDDTLGGIFIITWVCSTIVTLIYFAGSVA